MALLQHFQGLAWPYLVILPCLILISRLLLNKYGKGLNDVPGPLLAGFSDLWRVSNTMFSNPTEHLIRLHRQCNSNFVRIGPRVVSVSDPDLIPTIYGIKTPFKKTEFYSIIDLWHEGRFVNSMFETRDEEYHARIRRPIANAYSTAAVMEFEPAVDSTVELLMSKLDHFIASGESVPLEKWLQYYTFDVLYVSSHQFRQTTFTEIVHRGEIMFSKNLGFLESGTDIESIMSGIRFFTKYWQAVRRSPFKRYCSVTNNLCDLFRSAKSRFGTASCCTIL